MLNAELPFTELSVLVSVDLKETHSDNVILKNLSPSHHQHLVCPVLVDLTQFAQCWVQDLCVNVNLDTLASLHIVNQSVSKTQIVP